MSDFTLPWRSYRMWHYLCFFQNWEQISLQNLENITWIVVWFGFTDQCWSWNYNKCRKIAVSLLWDPKRNFKSFYDLNMLRVKLATSKDASLSRIAPSDHFWSNSLDDISSSQSTGKITLGFWLAKGKQRPWTSSFYWHDVTRLLARSDMKL